MTKLIKSIFVCLLFAPLCLYAQSAPKIQKGVDYPAYRKVLINAGWTPLKQVNECGFQCQSQRKSGFIEAQDCADAGTAPCIFIFKDKAGVILKVFTNGENLSVQRAISEK